MNAKIRPKKFNFVLIWHSDIWINIIKNKRSEAVQELVASYSDFLEIVMRGLFDMRRRLRAVGMIALEDFSDAPDPDIVDETDDNSPISIIADYFMLVHCHIQKYLASFCNVLAVNGFQQCASSLK